MKSEHLKEVFSELDSNSELVEFVASPSPPHFTISTKGRFTYRVFEKVVNTKELKSKAFFLKNKISDHTTIVNIVVI